MSYVPRDTEDVTVPVGTDPVPDGDGDGDDNDAVENVLGDICPGCRDNESGR